MNPRVPFLSLALTLLIIIASVFVVYYDSGPRGVYAQRDWNGTERIQVERTLDYLDYKEETLEFYSPDERSHMSDVRELFLWTRIVFFALLTVLLSQVATHFRMRWKLRPCKPLFSELLLWGGVTALGLIIVLGMLAALDFWSFWNCFHAVLFPQGNWLFPPDSLMISLFTSDFFVLFVRNVVFAAAAFSLISISASFSLRK